MHNNDVVLMFDLFVNKPFGKCLEHKSMVVSFSLDSAKREALDWVKKFEEGVHDGWRKVNGMNEHKTRINDKVLCVSFREITI